MAEVRPTLSSDINLSTPDSKVKLAYVYKGQCPDCNSQLKTLDQDLTIDNKSHHFVLAFCLSCDKQLQSREVTKLE